MDFNIRPISKVCAASGEPLAAGSQCWSVLVESDGKLVREDYSAEHWNGPPGNAIGFWSCQVPSDKSDDKRQIDPDSLMEYFVQLSESPNVAEQDYQYVLALLLLRKRRLILEETIESGDQTVMRVIGTGGEGPFDVVERELSDEQIATFQTQLYGGTSGAAA